jgi:hypothetical protein
MPMRINKHLFDMVNKGLYKGLKDVNFIFNMAQLYEDKKEYVIIDVLQETSFKAKEEGYIIFRIEDREWYLEKLLRNINEWRNDIDDIKQNMREIDDTLKENRSQFERLNEVIRFYETWKAVQFFPLQGYVAHRNFIEKTFKVIRQAYRDLKRFIDISLEAIQLNLSNIVKVRATCYKEDTTFRQKRAVSWIHHLEMVSKIEESCKTIDERQSIGFVIYKPVTYGYIVEKLHAYMFEEKYMRRLKKVISMLDKHRINPTAPKYEGVKKQRISTRSLSD